MVAGAWSHRRHRRVHTATTVPRSRLRQEKGVRRWERREQVVAGIRQLGRIAPRHEGRVRPALVNSTGHIFVKTSAKSGRSGCAASCRCGSRTGRRPVGRPSRRARRSTPRPPRPRLHAVPPRGSARRASRAPVMRPPSHLDILSRGAFLRWPPWPAAGLLLNNSPEECAISLFHTNRATTSASRRGTGIPVVCTGARVPRVPRAPPRIMPVTP